MKITERILHWIGHTLHKPKVATERHALHWNIQGKGRGVDKGNLTM